MVAVPVLVFRHALQKADNVSALVFVIVCSIALVYIPQFSRIVRANVTTAYDEDCVWAVIVADARAP